MDFAQHVQVRLFSESRPAGDADAFEYKERGGKKTEATLTYLAQFDQAWHSFA